MERHTLGVFDQKLDELGDLTQQMASHVRALILGARHALRSRDEELVDESRKKDKIINELSRRIEDRATVAMALYQPVAIDLRYLTSTLKIAWMLERAGDLAKNIVKRSVRMEDYGPEETIRHLERMADVAVSMLDKAMQAVAAFDTGGATQVWRDDDEADDLYYQVLASTQHDMSLNAGRVSAATQMIFIAKNFERIADYVTNVAKTVYYVTSGKPGDKSLLQVQPDVN